MHYLEISYLTDLNPPYSLSLLKLYTPVTIPFPRNILCFLLCRAVDALTSESRRVLRGMQQRDNVQKLVGRGLVAVVLVAATYAAFNALF